MQDHVTEPIRRSRGEAVPHMRRRTDADVAVLFTRWREERDPRAQELLTRQYLPLAYKLARRYWGAYEPVDDLRQVAAVGLIKAIDRFDPSRGIKFTSFAIPSILGELRRYFRDCGWAVHVPRGMQELSLSITKAQGELEDRHAVVTAQMIAQYLELPIELVSEALQASSAHHTSSLDAPIANGDEEHQTWGDGIGAVDHGFDQADIRVDVDRASRDLSEQDRTILKLRFEEDMSQAQIGAAVGVSQMQVSRILRRCTDHLAGHLQQFDHADVPAS